MGKIVATPPSLSVDGFFEGPDYDISWHMVDEELHTHMNQWLGAAGAFLEGRVTWELMADYWPTADEDPAAPAPIREFAGIWRDKSKYVFSKTLQEAGWGTTIVRDVVPGEIADLKASANGDLVVGGANLVETFMALDLVDEYRLYIHPVAIGVGSRFFPPDFKAQLRLAETRTFGNGVVMLRYDVARESS